MSRKEDSAGLVTGDDCVVLAGCVCESRLVVVVVGSNGWFVLFRVHSPVQCTVLVYWCTVHKYMIYQ